MELKNNEYFTPDIEDIRVGYECEIQDYKERWECTKAKDDMWGDFAALIDSNKIRVPYLTKEQIEAAGWKLSFDFSTLGPAHSMDFEKGDVWKDAGRGAFLSWNPHSNIIKITTSDTGYNQDGPNHSVKFKGECKDINTFRYICKLLGI